MLNPDGVFFGNTRVNLGGVDMNRRWSRNLCDPKITPEIEAMRDLLSKLNGRT